MKADRRSIPNVDQNDLVQDRERRQEFPDERKRELDRELTPCPQRDRRGHRNSVGELQRKVVSDAPDAVEHVGEILTGPAGRDQYREPARIGDHHRPARPAREVYRPRPEDREDGERR